MSARPRVWLLSFIPPAILAALTARFGCDVPFIDECRFAPMVVKAFQGSLPLREIWAQQNEHRAFFSGLTMLILARLSRWDVRWELAANIALAGGIFALCAVLLNRTARKNGPGAALPLVSLLVFSLTQWENWLWGIQLNEFLSLLAFCGVVVFLSRDKMRSKDLAAAAVCAVVSSYSFGNGLWSWPAALLLLGAARAPRRVLAATVGLASAVVLIYFAGYQRPAHHPAPVFDDPVRLVHFALIFLGGPVCNFDRSGAALAGLAGVAALGWASLRLLQTKSAGWRDLAPAWALAGYALASAAAAAVTRLGFGHVEGALASRYATFANPLWIALVLLLSRLVASLGKGNERRIWRAGGAFLAASAALSSLYGAAGFVHRGRQLEVTRDQLLLGAEHPVMPLVYPWPEAIDSCGHLLRENRLSLFRGGPAQTRTEETPPSLTPGAVQGSYAVTPLPATPAGLERFDVRGWAVDAQRGGEPERIVILGADKPLFSGPTFTLRRDLAWRYRNPRLLFTGFNYVFPGHPSEDLRVLGVASGGAASELSAGL